MADALDLTRQEYAEGLARVMGAHPGLISHAGIPADRWEEYRCSMDRTGTEYVAWSVGGGVDCWATADLLMPGWPALTPAEASACMATWVRIHGRPDALSEGWAKKIHVGG